MQEEIKGAIRAAEPSGRALRAAWRRLRGWLRDPPYTDEALAGDVRADVLQQVARPRETVAGRSVLPCSPSCAHDQSRNHPVGHQTQKLHRRSLTQPADEDHQGARVEGRRAGDGVQAHRVRAAALADGQRTAPGRSSSGPARSSSTASSPSGPARTPRPRPPDDPRPQMTPGHRRGTGTVYTFSSTKRPSWRTRAEDVLVHDH